MSYTLYVNDKVLQLVQLQSKSRCWIETIFLRGKEAGSWILIGVFKGKSVYKITVVHGAGKGKIVSLSDYLKRHPNCYMFKRRCRTISLLPLRKKRNCAAPPPLIIALASNIGYCDTACTLDQ